jgi:hypothetical protein
VTFTSGNTIIWRFTLGARGKIDALIVDPQQ